MGRTHPKQRARMDPSALPLAHHVPRMRLPARRTSTPGSMPATAGGGAADRARPLPGGDRPPSRVTVNQVVLDRAALKGGRRNHHRKGNQHDQSSHPRAPDGHGLDAVRRASSRSHTRQHVVIGIVGAKPVTTDYEKGSKGRPSASARSEAVTITDDLPMVQKLLIRATDKREGKFVLPIEVEDDLADAFKIRSEDIDTDITATGQLDGTRSRPSPARLTGPCGTRSPRRARPT